MRIGIDARTGRFPGIGRYTRELIHALADIDSENEYFIFLSSAHDVKEFSIAADNFTNVVTSTRVYTITEQFYLPRFILRYGLDIFHATTSLTIPLACPCQLVVTVHDMMLEVIPELLPSLAASLYFKLFNWRMVRSADYLITVSQFTATELIRLHPSTKDRITVILNGVNESYQPITDSRRLTTVRHTYGLPARYILYVGTHKKHKNLPTLLQAYATLPEDLRLAYGLVLVGKPDPRYVEVGSTIEQLNLRDHVRLIEHAREEDLPAIYSSASILVMTSVYEGFGLPVIEALACGTPVVVPRDSAPAEVAQGGGIAVNPFDVDAISSAIVTLLRSPKLYSRLRDAGLKRAKELSWHHTARQVVEVYDRLGTR